MIESTRIDDESRNYTAKFTRIKEMNQVSLVSPDVIEIEKGLNQQIPH